MATTYPLAANNSPFQRYDHEFPHAPCGPPWIRNFSGYFSFGSNPGGLTMNPWISSSFAPLNVNDSNGCMSICDNTASFMCVTSIDSLTCPVFSSALSDLIIEISAGARIEVFENQSCPLRDTKSSALKVPPQMLL